MAKEMQDAIRGLTDVLRIIPKLRIFPYSVRPKGGFPVAGISFNGRTAAGEDGLALGGSSFTAELTITVLVAKSLTEEAMNLMYEYINPLGTMSIEAALDADVTWNGTVDDGRLISVDEIDRVRFPGGAQYVGADFQVRFIKQVLT